MVHLAPKTTRLAERADQFPSRRTVLWVLEVVQSLLHQITQMLQKHEQRWVKIYVTLLYYTITYKAE